MLTNDISPALGGAQRDCLQEPAIAVVGFASIRIASENLNNTKNTGNFVRSLSYGIRHCLNETGISLSWLQKKNAATMIGLSDPFQTDDEPVLVAPKVAKELGLENPGMTCEVGEASGMAAIHFAKSKLGNSNCRFAIVAELQHGMSEEGDVVNVLLLQNLAEALADGMRVHGLIKSSAMGFGADAESLLADCCERAELARNRVLRISTKPTNTINAMFDWMSDTDEELDTHNDPLVATGFSAYATCGTRVSLLLQAPLIAPQMGDDAMDDELFMNETMEEGYAPLAPAILHLAHQQQDMSDDIFALLLKGEDLGRTNLGVSWAGMDAPVFLAPYQGEV